GMRRNLIAVNLNKSLPEDIWDRDEPLELTHRDIVWEATTGTPDSCSPVVHHNLLFLVSDDGIGRCFDAVNGKLHWKERLAGGYKASPLAVDGRIYFLNTDGVCTIVSASTRFNKLAENKLEDTTLASPA